MPAPGNIGKKPSASSSSAKPATSSKAAKPSAPVTPKKGGPPGNIGKKPSAKPASPSAPPADKKSEGVEERSLRVELEEARMRILSLESELKDALNQQGDERDQQLEGLRNQLESELEARSEQEQELQDLQERLDAARKRIKELESQTPADNEAQAKLEAELVEVRAELAKESAERMTAEESLNEKERKLTELAQALKNSNSKSELALAHARKSIEELQSRLENESKAAAKLREQSAKLKQAEERIEALEADNRKIGEQNAHLKREASKAPAADSSVIKQLTDNELQLKERLEEAVKARDEWFEKYDTLGAKVAGVCGQTVLVDDDPDSDYKFTFTDDTTKYRQLRQQLADAVGSTVVVAYNGDSNEFELKASSSVDSDEMTQLKLALEESERNAKHYRGLHEEQFRILSDNNGKTVKIIYDGSTGIFKLEELEDFRPLYNNLYNLLAYNVGKAVRIVHDSGSDSFKFEEVHETSDEFKRRLVDSINHTLPAELGHIEDHNGVVRYIKAKPLTPAPAPSQGKAKRKCSRFEIGFIVATIVVFFTTVGVVTAITLGKDSDNQGQQPSTSTSVSAEVETEPVATESAPATTATVVEAPNAQPPVTAPAETAKPTPEAKVEKKIACFPANATNLRRYLYQIDPEHFLYQIDPFSREKLSLSCGDGQVQATENPDGTHDVSSCDICLPEGYEPDTWVDISPEVLRAFTAQSGDPAHYVEPQALKGHHYGEDVMRFGQFSDGYPRVWGVSRSRDLTTGKLHLPPVEGEVTYY